MSISYSFSISVVVRTARFMNVILSTYRAECSSSDSQVTSTVRSI